MGVQGIVSICLGSIGLLAASINNFGLILTTYISAVTFIIIFILYWPLYIIVNILNVYMILSSYTTVRLIHKGITTLEKEDKKKLLIFEWPRYIIGNILNVILIIVSLNAMSVNGTWITTEVKEDKEKPSKNHGQEVTLSKFTQTDTAMKKDDLTSPDTEVNVTTQPKIGFKQEEIVKNDLLIGYTTVAAIRNLFWAAVALTVYIIDAH